MVRKSDTVQKTCVVVLACSSVACNEQSSIGESTDQPSGVQNSSGTIGSTRLFIANNSISPSPSGSEITGDIPDLGASVDVTSTVAAASALPDENAAVRTEQEEHGYPYTTSGTHVSALAYLQPERVALSSIGRHSQFVYFTNGIEAPALFSEVYVAQTNPEDMKVCRLAHHRSFG